MSYYYRTQEEPSEKGKVFREGQEVSFIYRKEMRMGRIEVLRVNSAVISVKALRSQKEDSERTVIRYDKMMSVYK